MRRWWIASCAVAMGLTALLQGQPDEALVPFTMNHRLSGGSLADVSFLLSPPAGKDGFIRVEGSHFVTPDGQRARFWGVNITDWSDGSVMVPPKEEAPRVAATLARYGVNCVRLHFLDLDAPRGLVDGTRNDSRRSTRTTSAACSAQMVQASSPDPASPTTTMSGCRPMIADSPNRTTGWSSTMTTRILGGSLTVETTPYAMSIASSISILRVRPSVVEPPGEAGAGLLEPGSLRP